MLKVRSAGGITTWAEAKKKTKGIQCFKCQQFGHVQFRCTAEPKCLKCAGSHRTFECKRTGNSRKCANCAGPHAASDMTCPKNPRTIVSQTRAPSDGKTKEGVSYSKIAGPKPTPAPRTRKNPVPALPAPQTPTQPMMEAINKMMVSMLEEMIPSMMNKWMEQFQPK